MIHGSERTILCQEKVADNRIMVFYNKKSQARYSHSVEMKSLHESFTTPPKKLEVRVSSKFNGLGYPLLICVPRFHEDLPLVVFFRALGVTKDREIRELVFRKEEDTFAQLLAGSFKEAADLNIFTQQQAIEYLTEHLQYTTQMEDKTQ